MDTKDALNSWLFSSVFNRAKRGREPLFVIGPRFRIYPPSSVKILAVRITSEKRDPKWNTMYVLDPRHIIKIHIFIFHLSFLPPTK